MSKNEKKPVSILQEIDESLDESYETLKDEIEAMQIKIAIADAEADRKIRKRMRKDPNYVVTNRKKISIRRQVLREMEQTSFVERVTEALEIITPAIVVIARLVAALIQLILSIPIIRESIPKEFMDKLLRLYEFCASVKFA